MFSRPPTYLSDASQRLSQVLDEVGLNENMRFVRQKTNLLMERMECLRSKVSCHNSVMYYFGSQTEGSTTAGLGSDKDKLMCTTLVNVVQDETECIEGKCNVLIVQDDTTPPGYCSIKLYDLGRSGFNGKYGYDRQGNYFLQNTFLHDTPIDKEVGSVRQGPAQTVDEFDIDHVPAFQCRSWPKEAKQWARCLSRDQWPYDHMRRHSEQTGCFVVPTGNSLSENENYEWRISTSQAERCFMFNMNITQIRCYTMLKIIMKTIIKPLVGETLTSFQCKSMLMNVVENMVNQRWTEDRLLEYILSCLRLLKACVASNNCPHYFIPKNNLLGGRLNRSSRRDIEQELESLIHDGCRKILSVKVDNIGERFILKFSTILELDLKSSACPSTNSKDVQLHVLCKLFRRLFAAKLMFVYLITLQGIEDSTKALPSMVDNLLALNFFGNESASDAAQVMNPVLCLTVGSMIASVDISMGQTPSAEAMQFLKMGLHSDVAAGRLKLASVLYCAGAFEEVERVLRDVENRFETLTVLAVCNCRSTDPWTAEDDIPAEVTKPGTFGKLHFASGVSFNRHERYCVPKPLQYEMFRCTGEELNERGDVMYLWNDWAVVDALPYLYFLQYLTFKRLGKNNDKEKALDRLAQIIVSDPLLFHRETAMNLLGQCMELEEHIQFALVCYSWSLMERDTHNVARWLVSILIWKIYRGEVEMEF
ncbi:uncharacterized protein LOC123557316 [Mercenaria mercenaria]|uniref:uncharacterized protein LOC123557316 n=1 Tax=Mercenaria mercenaria TaxID=6596 RepID=UPI00234EF677|nr:uncharacterized protein LOC123557316 [Mercenaria mercenaria]